MIRGFKNLLRRPGAPAPESDSTPQSTECAAGENVLIVSDLHLGEACKEHSRIDYIRHSTDADADFCAFLDHYAQHSPDERPWRLVLGGDLFDFLQVTLTPPDADAHARRYGLGTTADESAWKMERLFERHRRAFVHLAHFVGCGHRLDIVQGNHDVELFWPEVQHAFVSGLVRLYFGEEGHPALTPTEFEARIHFHAWFVYVPGVVYVEHGHRFDPYCSTAPQLAPLRPERESELTQPLSGIAIRYFANLERGFSTHDKEHWGLKEYVGYYRGRRFRDHLETIRRYWTFVVEVERYYRNHGRFASERAVADHAIGLAALTESSGLDETQLARLDALSEASVTSIPFALYAKTGLAEITSAAFVAMTGTIVLLTPWSWLTDLCVFGLGFVAGAVWPTLARRRFPTDAPTRLDRTAIAVSRIVDAPAIVFGHSHCPIRTRMPHDHRVFYVNSGSFLPPSMPAHNRTEPCRCPTTFVVIELGPAHARPRPSLRRWCTVRGAPAPFDN